jgi:hypothetical protein
MRVIVIFLVKVVSADAEGKPLLMSLLRSKSRRLLGAFFIESFTVHLRLLSGFTSRSFYRY